MGEKREWLAFRVNQKSKEILAYKGSGITFRALQKRLDFEGISYDAFRRHVARIWESSEAPPKVVGGLAAPPSAPVGDSKLASPPLPSVATENPPERKPPLKRPLRFGEFGKPKDDLDPAKWRERFDLEEEGKDSSKSS